MSVAVRLRPMPLLASAILFDLDGVLADSTPSVIRAWSAWARRVGLEPDRLLPMVHGRRAIDTIRAVRPELDAESELATLVADETTDNADTEEIPGARALVSALPADRWAIVTSGLRPVATARLVAAGVPIPRVMITAESISARQAGPRSLPQRSGRTGRRARATASSSRTRPPVPRPPAPPACVCSASRRRTAPPSCEPAELIVPDLTHVTVASSARSCEVSPR